MLLLLPILESNMCVITALTTKLTEKTTKEGDQKTHTLKPQLKLSLKLILFQRGKQTHLLK